MPRQLEQTVDHIIEQWKIGVQLGVPCGDGSTWEGTRQARAFISRCIVELGIKSVNDAPCGDYSLWMFATALNGATYRGFDLNPELVRQNKSRFPSVEFHNFDLINAVLPQADLIICRDCLFHLSTKDGVQVLKNFRDSKSTYLISTTFPSLPGNVELGHFKEWKCIIDEYGYRPVNLEIEPYSLGAPLKFVEEPAFKRGLGLWKL